MTGNSVTSNGEWSVDALAHKRGESATLGRVPRCAVQNRCPGVAGWYIETDSYVPDQRVHPGDIWHLKRPVIVFPMTAIQGEDLLLTERPSGIPRRNTTSYRRDPEAGKPRACVNSEQPIRTATPPCRNSALIRPALQMCAARSAGEASDQWEMNGTPAVA